MIVSALDVNGDWNFGRGINDYLRDQAAIDQTIKTRLLMFLGDCFFALNVGLDWFNFLSGKDQIKLRNAISSTIRNTFGVISLQDLSFNLDRQTRHISIVYSVTTIFSSSQLQTFTANLNFLLTEDGSVLTTEDGTPILA